MEDPDIKEMFIKDLNYHVVIKDGQRQPVCNHFFLSLGELKEMVVELENNLTNNLVPAEG